MRHYSEQMPTPLDSFISAPDVRERFHKKIKAPSNIVMEVACNIDLQSLYIVRLIFRLRDRFMKVSKTETRKPQGLIDEMSSLGWGLLAKKEGQLVIYGSACQPWLADPNFKPIPSDQFLQYDSPYQIKIARTLEAESIGPSETLFIHETRVVATDASYTACIRKALE